MRFARLAAFGWLVPGGAYLLTRRYVQFGLSLGLVLTASVSGMALGGGNLWPHSADLAGLDLFTVLLAKAAALTKLLAGTPYLLARLCGYSQSPFDGRLHEYGTTLLVIAGLLNLLALADALE
jgi:hypothetical protein